jgi:protein phosphatase
MLNLEFAQLTDCGRVRDHNEDYFGYVAPETPAQIRHQGWMFALADGVGGQDCGEVASRAAVETVLAGFREHHGKEALTSLLPRLIQAANSHVYETGAGTPKGSNMATTLVVCVFRFDRVVVAHVGDSRCYLIRKGQATVLTRDHTVANESKNLSMLSGWAGGEAPGRHVLSRSIGNDLVVGVDIAEHHTLPGDVFLLCSDGMYGAVPATKIARIVTDAPDLPAAAQSLVAIANERDGGDNISVQLIRVRSVERVGMYRGRPYQLR